MYMQSAVAQQMHEERLERAAMYRTVSQVRALRRARRRLARAERRMSRARVAASRLRRQLETAA